MGKIQILPPELINHIAAGEVVERPASVVKELVENAIDAGSTRIEVAASDGGRNLRVADNGCGMDAEDLQVAFKNHATSKVKALDDLFQIETLGFRGEALASLAAIAKVTCLTRTAQATTGLKALVQPSGEVTLHEAGCSPGTIFEIRELFYNVPARLKFLKRPQTELSHIQETVQMLALSHPEVAFQLSIEGAQALKTSGSGQLLTALNDVFVLSESDALLPFAMADEEFGYRVWGQTSTPNVTRGSRKWMMTFVNGRTVRCPILGKAIESAYTSLITPGKFPVTALFLEMPLDEVDVNVHPTKREVKYQRANTMFSFVRRAIEQALLQAGPLSPQETTGREGARLSMPRGEVSARRPEPPRSPSGSYSQAAGMPYRSAGGGDDAPRATAPTSLIPTQAALELYAPATASDTAWTPELAEFRVIGQLAKTYILLETESGLQVVDQHIAAERVLFERFSEQTEAADPASQPLLLPMRFPLSPVQADSLAENRSAFEALGFAYTLAEHEVQFTQVPSLFNEKVLRASLEGMLHHLEETGEVALSVDDVIATAACHSAVRAGDVLNHEQMQRVIAQWLACQRPWTCPHGRPVSHTLTHGDLMRFFDRPSLPA